MREVLFKTVHGSRLYGLNTADSDYDYYTVVTKLPVDNRWNRQTKAKYAKQSITGDEDSLVIDFGTWVEQCKSGVPQALEAMFSDMAVVDHIAAFRSDFKVSTGIVERYLRTIKSFALAEDETIKRRRHAVRLAYNLREASMCGRFNPTLSAGQAIMATDMASLAHEEVYRLALDLAFGEN